VSEFSRSVGVCCGRLGAAADLPQPMPPPPQAPVAYIPAVAPVYNWGGIYWGINGGYGFGTSEWTDPANSSGTCSTGNFNVSGFQVGPTFGINYQADAFVFGIEGDLDSSWLDGKKSSSFCGSVGFDTQRSAKPRTPGSARRGPASATRPTACYGTFGGPYDNIQSGVNGLVNSDKAGWVAGAGIEARSATTGRRGSNICSSTCRTRRARPPAHAGWTPAAQPPTIPSNSTPT
jgi:outer membrane immunogenic protein